MKVGDLPVNPRLICMMHCIACGENTSCTRGDYFVYEPSRELVCGCGGELQLVEREVSCQLHHPMEKVTTPSRCPPQNY